MYLIKYIDMNIHLDYLKSHFPLLILVFRQYKNNTNKNKYLKI